MSLTCLTYIYKQSQKESQVGRKITCTKWKNLRKNTLKELNKIKVGNLLNTEFKKMVIRMCKELKENFKKLSENSNSMKKDQNHKK